METRRYADFSRELHARLQGRRIPLSGTIELTRRCHLHCVHCYNNLPVDDDTARAAELTCDEHCRLLDEIAEEGCLWILYTGGEIFLRDDFPDIYAYAKKKGFLITLFTNGTLLTPAIADFLADRPPFLIEITLYGATSRTHESVTGVEGSFEQCMDGIRLLRERGLPLRLKTMALTLNRLELESMRRLAEEQWGLEFRFDAMINSRIDCASTPLSVRLSPQEVVELDLKDPRRMMEWRRFCEEFCTPAGPRNASDALYDCGGGIHSFAVDPCGMLRICSLSNGDGYDLRRGTFREGWENFIPEMRQRKATRRTGCTDCGLKAMCGMCPAQGELENKDAETPVGFLCEAAHLRAKALGLSVGDSEPFSCIERRGEAPFDQGMQR